MSPHGLSEAHSNPRVEIYVGVHDQATVQLVAPSDPTGPNSPLPRLHYNVSQHQIRKSTRGSLVDRGANGGIIGNDARVILYQRTARRLADLMLTNIVMKSW